MKNVSSFVGLGAALRRIRLGKELTLDEVGKRAGIHTSSLSRFERGTLHLKLETLDRILEGLGADALDLGLALRLESGRTCELQLPEGLPEAERAALTLAAFGFEDFVKSLVRRSKALRECGYSSTARVTAQTVRP